MVLDLEQVLHPVDVGLVEAQLPLAGDAVEGQRVGHADLLDQPDGGQPALPVGQPEGHAGLVGGAGLGCHESDPSDFPKNDRL